jgi:hypothetical protein
MTLNKFESMCASNFSSKVDAIVLGSESIFPFLGNNRITHLRVWGKGEAETEWVRDGRKQ